MRDGVLLALRIMPRIELIHSQAGSPSREAKPVSVCVSKQFQESRVIVNMRVSSVLFFLLRLCAVHHLRGLLLGHTDAEEARLCLP